MSQIDAHSSSVKELIQFLISQTAPPQTCEFRDLLVRHVAPHLTAGQIRLFGLTISTIAQDAKAAELFVSTADDLAAILNCFHRVVSPEASHAIVAALRDIVNKNPKAKEILNTLPVVEAFSVVIPFATSQAAAHVVLSAILALISDNNIGLAMFGTKQFLAAVKNLEEPVKGNEDAKKQFKMVSFCVALNSATTTEEMNSAIVPMTSWTIDKCFVKWAIDVIVQKQNLIADSSIAHAVIAMFRTMSSSSSSRPFLTTEPVANLIVRVLAPKLSCGVSAENFGSMIYDLDDVDFVKMIASVEYFKAVLDLFHCVKTPNSVIGAGKSLARVICKNQSCNKMLNELPVVEAFSAIIPHTTTSGAADWILFALRLFLEQNDEGKNLFANAKFLIAFDETEKYATESTAKSNFTTVVAFFFPLYFECLLQYASLQQNSLARALNKITKQSKFSTSFVNLFLEKQHLIQDHDSVVAAAKFIEWCAMRDEKSIGIESVRVCYQEVILPKSILFPKSVPDVMQALIVVLSNDAPARDFFLTSGFKNFVVAALQHARESCLQVVKLLVNHDRSKSERVFGLESVLAKFSSSFAAEQSNTDEWKKFRQLLRDLIVQPRIESLRLLCEQHSCNIDGTVLTKLGMNGIDAANVQRCNETILNGIGVIGAKQFPVLDLIRKIKNDEETTLPCRRDREE